MLEKKGAGQRRPKYKGGRVRGEGVDRGGGNWPDEKEFK